MVVDQELDLLPVFFSGGVSLVYRARPLVADLEDEHRKIQNRNIPLEACQRAVTETTIGEMAARWDGIIGGRSSGMTYHPS